MKNLFPMVEFRINYTLKYQKQKIFLAFLHNLENRFFDAANGRQRKIIENIPIVIWDFTCIFCAQHCNYAVQIKAKNGCQRK